MVNSQFKNLFTFMENHDILDWNEVHLWALNYGTYIQLIIVYLSLFLTGTTIMLVPLVAERPLQLWHTSMIENQHSLHNFGMTNVPNLEQYRIGNFTEADCSDLDNNVEVPRMK